MAVKGGALAWRFGFVASVLAMLGALALLAPYLSSSAELVRMRNALLVQDVSATNFDWSPVSVPADYLAETGPIDARFAARVGALQLEREPDNWSRALALGRHLLENRHGSVGGAIQSNLERTYSVIRETGRGYCGDYADVFAAMALAAGVPVRSWAFSFDGFGGSGHIFNEVWDEAGNSWRLIDVFHNYYFTDPAGEVLSAQAFRKRMLENPDTVRFELIEPQARLVFRHEQRAREFYLRGLAEWYLWWGNNLYSYDRAALVKAFSRVHRSLEQLGGIIQGVHPGFRVLAEPGNAAQREAIVSLRVRMFVALALGVLGLIGALWCMVGWVRGRAAAMTAEIRAREGTEP